MKTTALIFMLVSPAYLNAAKDLDTKHLFQGLVDHNLFVNTKGVIDHSRDSTLIYPEFLTGLISASREPFEQECWSDGVQESWSDGFVLWVY